MSKSSGLNLFSLLSNSIESDINICRITKLLLNIGQESKNVNMPSPAGDPTYIKNKERYFIEVAEAVAKASTHPRSPGGCIIVRDREIIGDGRSLLTDSKVEIDCISYAIAAAARNGTPAIGAVVYSTRYPFSTSIFQAHMMGIKKIIVSAS